MSHPFRIGPPGRTPDRTPIRRHVARRRAILAFVVVVTFTIGWQLWASGDAPDESTRAAPAPTASGAGDGRPSDAPTRAPVTPRAPIEHVVFMVKENRTFDSYFGAYPGAEGVSRGETLRCTQDGCRPGPTVPLKPAPDVIAHDITHGFQSGMYAINGGEMNGFNVIGDGQDLTGYVQYSRKSIPAYWAYADRYVLSDQVGRSFHLGPGHHPLHAFIEDARDHHRIGAAQRGADHRVACCGDKLDVAGYQRTNASGAAPTDDDYLGIETVFLKKAFFLGDPKGAMSGADGTQSDPHFLQVGSA